MMNWFWPEFENIDDAKKALYNGAGMAFFVAVVTAVVTYLHVSGTFRFFEEWSASAYLDAALFTGIGIGLIIFKSRIVAIAAVLIYGGEQYFMMKTIGYRFSIVPIFVMLSFVNAVRGAFAYHDLKNADREGEALQNAVQEVDSEKPPRKFPIIPVVIGLAVVAGLIFLIPVLKQNLKLDFGSQKIITQKLKLDGILMDEQSPVASIDGNLLQKGDTYEGHLVKEIGADYVVLERTKDGKSVRLELFPDLNGPGDSGKPAAPQSPPVS